MMHARCECRKKESVTLLNYLYIWPISPSYVILICPRYLDPPSVDLLSLFWYISNIQTCLCLLLLPFLLSYTLVCAMGSKMSFLALWILTRCHLGSVLSGVLARGLFRLLVTTFTLSSHFSFLFSQKRL